MAQQWFVKTKSGSAGPFTSQKLKQLAQNEKIKARSPISLDGKKWFAAEKVQGLIPPSVEMELTEDDLIEEEEAEEEFDAQAELAALGLGPDGLPPGVFGVAIPPKTSDMIGVREAAYEKVFGPYSKVIHPLGPGLPHIDVYIYPPNKKKDRPFTTLVTGGMSDHAMPVPPGGPCSTRCELMFYVDKPKKVYINLLRFLGSMPYEQNTYFTYGSTVNNGNPPQPIFEGSVLDHYLFLFPLVDSDLDLQDTTSIKGSPLQLLLVTPITAAERKLVMKKNLDGLFPLLEKYEHPLTLDPTRKCYVKRGGWFG